MKSKIFMICAKISTVIFVLFVCLCIYLWIFHPNPTSDQQSMHWRHIPLGYDINVTASSIEDREWLIFFNGPMPNHATMFGSTANEKFYEGWGFYFRLINNSASKITWCTLMISLWYPIALFGILPAIFVVKKWRKRKLASTKEATIEKCDP